MLRKIPYYKLLLFILLIVGCAKNNTTCEIKWYDHSHTFLIEFASKCYNNTFPTKAKCNEESDRLNLIWWKDEEGNDIDKRHYYSYFETNHEYDCEHVCELYDGYFGEGSTHDPHVDVYGGCTIQD